MINIERQNLHSKLKEIRHHLHSIPELGLREKLTSGFIMDCLQSWGVEYEKNIATTGLVATLDKGNSNTAIAFRADMDALPITETGQIAYKSLHRGNMHACGHDGHMSILLGAIWKLLNDDSFQGKVHFIFQPAEENLGGAKIMLDEGLLAKYPCQHMFALHNWPGLKASTFALKEHSMTASIDAATVSIFGKGGHSAEPEKTIDPILTAASITCSLQSIVSRNAPSLASSNLNVGAFHAGTVSNIIPDKATLEISLRAHDEKIRQMMISRVESLIKLQAESFGASSKLDWQTGYPCTFNDSQTTQFAANCIRKHFADDQLQILKEPLMVSEDFAFFSQVVPSCYVLIGNGNSSFLHTAEYDFNDDILITGAEYFYQLSKEYFDNGLCFKP